VDGNNGVGTGWLHRGARRTAATEKRAKEKAFQTGPISPNRCGSCAFLGVFTLTPLAGPL